MPAVQPPTVLCRRGVEKPVSGEARFGEHNIIPNFFEQNQAEALDLGLTVLETLQRAAPDAMLNDIKALLGQMMFSGGCLVTPQLRAVSCCGQEPAAPNSSGPAGNSCPSAPQAR